MRIAHPLEPLCHLYLDRRRERLRIVQRRGLNIHQTRQYRLIAIKQPAATVRTETAHRTTRRIDRLRLTLDHHQRGLVEHRPSHHRRPRTAPTIAAMTQGDHLGLTRELVTDGTTQTLSGITHCTSPCSSTALSPDNVECSRYRRSPADKRAAKSKRAEWRVCDGKLAEAQGFEPWNPCGLPVFKFCGG